jgi:hypothetical protein
MQRLFISIILFVSGSIQAQPYLSFKGTTKGAGPSIGYLEKNSGIEFNAGYNVPVLKTGLPTILNISLGKQVLLTHKEKDNLSFIFSVGCAHYSISDFSNYDKSGGREDIVQIKKIKPICGVELGKDWYLGCLFLSVSYCDGAILGVGLKGYIR